jgi:hypothetical protein
VAGNSLYCELPNLGSFLSPTTATFSRDTNDCGSGAAEVKPYGSAAVQTTVRRSPNPIENQAGVIYIQFIPGEVSQNVDCFPNGMRI